MSVLTPVTLVDSWTRAAIVLEEPELLVNPLRSLGLKLVVPVKVGQFWDDSQYYRSRRYNIRRVQITEIDTQKRVVGCSAYLYGVSPFGYTPEKVIYRTFPLSEFEAEGRFTLSDCQAI